MPLRIHQEMSLYLPQLGENIMLRIGCYYEQILYLCAMEPPIHENIINTLFMLDWLTNRYLGNLGSFLQPFDHYCIDITFIVC